MLLFGRLQEVAGWRERMIEALLPTLSSLQAELSRQDAVLGQALARPGVQVAVDKALVRGDPALPAGAEVAFLPPMSGG